MNAKATRPAIMDINHAKPCGYIVKKCNVESWLEDKRNVAEKRRTKRLVQPGKAVGSRWFDEIN